MLSIMVGTTLGLLTWWARDSLAEAVLAGAVAFGTTVRALDQMIGP
jgi:hypothetical protein